MDHNNLSFKAILMKYRCPFVPSLFQKRPSCFPKRCLLLDSQRVNENARVIRRSLPMSLFGPCPTSSGRNRMRFAISLVVVRSIRPTSEVNGNARFLRELCVDSWIMRNDVNKKNDMKSFVNCMPYCILCLLYFDVVTSY